VRDKEREEKINGTDAGPGNSVTLLFKISYYYCCIVIWLLYYIDDLNRFRDKLG